MCISRRCFLPTYPQIPQALRDRLKVMAAKTDVPQPVTPRPNRLKLGGSVGSGCSRSEALRSREVRCIFWRGMGGT